MTAKTVLQVSGSRLRPERLLARITEAGHGGQALFIGVVRDSNLGRRVGAVSYEADAALALKVFAELAREARKKWGKGMGAAIAHRRGRLKVGEASVVVAAASAHRAEALQACRYMIDELKKRAPVWKKEHYVSGDSAWVPGCSLRR